MILKNVKFLLFLFSILGHTTVYGCKQPLLSKMASSNCFERKKWDIQIFWRQITFRLPTTAPSKSASLETNNLSRPQDFLQTSPQYRRDVVVLLWMCKIISWLERYLNLVGQDTEMYFIFALTDLMWWRWTVKEPLKWTSLSLTSLSLSDPLQRMWLQI